jgi:hypothetical protein
MQRRRTDGFIPRSRIPEPLNSQLKLAIMVATAALPLLLVASLVPRPLVLPLLCLIAVAGALITSLIAWRRGVVDNAQRVTAWDVAGALAFIACAAAIMSDPNQVASLTTTTTTVADLTGAARPPHP